MLNRQIQLIVNKYLKNNIFINFTINILIFTRVYFVCLIIYAEDVTVTGAVLDVAFAK